jgi:glycosyltransferase involved in cell wall biosynthesis
MKPRVTVVTPCLNGARFLEQTIRSVLDQDYPNLEYIVMDGGSTDATIEILKRFESVLHWESAPDSGTPEAVNRGFSLSTGEILGFLNADDVYHPGAVSAAVRQLERDPDAAGVYGDAWWIDEKGGQIGLYPVRDFDRRVLERECFICQPASFVRREPFENAGGLDPRFPLTFDYEFWLRLTRVYSLSRIDQTLADSRIHRANKTISQREGVFRETFHILKRDCGYVPFQWIYGYLCYQDDAHDQFFRPLRPSIPRYLESLPVGLWINSSAMGRYAADWAGVMSWDAFLRRVLRNSR